MKFRYVTMLSAAVFSLAGTGCAPENTTDPVFSRNLSLSQEYVEMDPLESVTIEITDGNGDYSAVSVNPEIASVSVADGKVKIKGERTGITSVIVSDKDGVNGLVSILVLGDIELETYEVQVDAGDRTLNLVATPKTIKVVFGNGNYSVTSDGDAEFVVNGNEIEVKAYQLGEITATVKDRTGRTKDFKIIGSDPYLAFKNSEANTYFYDDHGPYFLTAGTPSDTVKDKHYVFNKTFNSGMTAVFAFELRIPLAETLSVGLKTGGKFYFTSLFNGRNGAVNVGSAASPVDVEVAVLKNDGQRVWLIFQSDTFSGTVCRPIPQK